MIRVLLVDDQALVRSGFRVILEAEADIEVVGEAANGVEAVSESRRLRPDVICMDVEMPEMDGIEASRQILGGVGAGVGTPSSGGASVGALSAGAVSAGAAAPAILVLTTFGHERYLFSALEAGVSGFLLKTSRAEDLVAAIRALARGEALLGPEVTRAVLDRLGGASDRGEAPDPQSKHAAMVAAGLTEREQEVLGLVADGRSNAEIAEALFLGEATVKTHVSNVLQKLGVRDRIQAVVWVLGSQT